MIDERLPKLHPGEILLEEFIEPLGLTKNALATSIGVPATRIGEIVRGALSISADTGLRLSTTVRLGVCRLRPASAALHTVEPGW
ncbi:HigA family addiction module antitoxin [Salinicola sp. V024]|uniref:HigA family addiction module antitoxin n=1 Tax=Salinicola sp. V024 TaxID=3459609 RepID=UPI004044755E